MGVLHVVHRVFVGLFLCQFEVEIKLAVGAPHEKVVPCGVPAHLVDHLAKRHILPGTGGHGHGLAVAQQAHELHENDLQGFPVPAERLDTGLQPGDISVMVCAPHVDDEIESPVELVLVIGDVRRKISGCSGVTDDDPVLLVAECRRPEPERVALPVDISLFPERFQKFHDAIVLVELPLAEVTVEGDAEGSQVVLDPLHDGAGGIGREGRQNLVFALAPVAVPVSGKDLLRKPRDVIALVVILRKFDGLTQKRQVAEVHGSTEGPHLVAHVVDVVLLDGFVTGRREDVCDHVARDGATRVPDVQGARGVCADELHLDLFSNPEIESAVAVLLAVDLPQQGAPVFLLDEEIDEARPCDLHFAQQMTLILELGGDGLGDHAGVLLRLGGDHHGHVCRIVAVSLVAGDLQFNDRKLVDYEQAFGYAERR